MAFNRQTVKEVFMKELYISIFMFITFSINFLSCNKITQKPDFMLQAESVSEKNQVNENVYDVQMISLPNFDEELVTALQFSNTNFEEEINYAEDDSIKPLFPKMIEIREEKNNLNIEISETLITMEEYKSYLVQNNSFQADYFENWAADKMNFTDAADYQKDWPVFSVSWREAAEYCNWLSRENDLQPVYSYSFYNEPIADKNANGYRFPYVSELLVLSGLKDGLSREQYENENFCEKTAEPFIVYNGKKNKYGLYDLLGNLPQYCNDFFLTGYDYFNCEKNQYGPEEYTNDEEAMFFWENGETLYDDTKKEPLMCAFGCYCFRASYESVTERVVLGTNSNAKNNFIGIRVVRNIP